MSPGAALQAVLSLGKSVKQLEITCTDDPAKPDLGDGITAPRLVQDVHLVPGFWQIDGYTKIKQYLFGQLTSGFQIGKRSAHAFEEQARDAGQERLASRQAPDINR